MGVETTTKLSLFLAKLQPLKLKAAGRFRRFAVETSIHGFKEFTESESNYEKLFWLCVVLFCSVVFVVHTNRQFGQYVTGKNSLVISTLPDKEYVRPIVYIRLFNWSYIDVRKLKFYNITYEQLRMAKSYLEPVEYRSNLTLEQAKTATEEKFREMNIRDIQQFFAKLSFDDKSLGIELEDQAYAVSKDSRQYFLQTYYKEDFAHFVINLAHSKKKSIQLANVAMYTWNFTTYWNTLATYGLPEVRNDALNMRPLLMCQKFDDIFMEPLNRYVISYDVRVYRPLPPCRNVPPGQLFQYSIDHCIAACWVEVNTSMNINSCFEYEASSSRLITQWPLCSSGFLLDNDPDRVVGQEKPVYRRLSIKESEQRNQYLSNCFANCQRPCHLYTITSSISTTLFTWSRYDANMSYFRVYYPDHDVVTVFQEQDLYNLLDFVSDFGGALGLWLGASAVSVFQLVKLCLWPVRKVARISTDSVLPAKVHDDRDRQGTRCYRCGNCCKISVDCKTNWRRKSDIK